MRLTTGLVVGLLSICVHAETRHAGAHVHGLNHVQIVLDGTTLQVNYEFPIAQLQEHGEHKHDEHKHDRHKNDQSPTLSETEIKDKVAISELIRLPEDAECVQINTVYLVRNAVADGKATEESGHQDVVIEATMKCEQPDKVISLDFAPAFNKFDDLEKIEVEGMVGNRPLSETLSRKRASTSI
ncbi:MAG: DUF2796 domain-containing protein [Gammaproteobacteria bacterium]